LFGFFVLFFSVSYPSPDPDRIHTYKSPSQWPTIYVVAHTTLVLGWALLAVCQLILCTRCDAGSVERVAVSICTLVPHNHRKASFVHFSPIIASARRTMSFTAAARDHDKESCFFIFFLI
jgi:hypothetical protein